MKLWSSEASGTERGSRHDEAEFNQALAEKKAREEAIASSFAGAPDEEITGLLLEFLCCKYLLHPEEIRSENLIQLESRVQQNRGDPSRGRVSRKIRWVYHSFFRCDQKDTVGNGGWKVYRREIGSGSGRCGGDCVTIS